ncbi:MAG: hypothetical protein ACXV3C_09635 [Actinomycetes bacterium]
MNDLPFAIVLSQSTIARDALSAQPHAPVVPHRERRGPLTRGTRHALASGLRRAAVAIEPAECVPAR